MSRIPTDMALRVLHVVDSQRPDAGSVAISLRGLVPALKARGVESEAVATDGPWVYPGTDEVSAAGSPPRIEDVDLVHVHGWGYELARITTRAARRGRRPYVLSPHGAIAGGGRESSSWPDRLRMLWRERGLVRHAASVTALNEHEFARLRASGVNDNVRLLPYGLVCGEYEDPVNIPDSQPLDGDCILVLGPIEPKSGCVALLKAFAEIGPDAEGWTIVIAGRDTGEWRKMLEAAVRRKGGADRVVFVPDPDMATQRAWLARADVLAAPSTQVRFEAAILQAVSAGVFVLASACAVPPDLDDVVKVYAPDRGELRETLRSVLKMSAEQRAESAERARTHGRGVCDWSVLVDRYVKVYEGSVEKAAERV